jgi:integrase
MATIIKDPKSGFWRIAFRFGEKQFTRSLKTADEREAGAICGRVEETLGLIRRGRIVVPEGANVGSFILSDGKLHQKPGQAPPGAAAATIGDVIVAYEGLLPAGAKRANSLRTEATHLGHVGRILGAATPLEKVDLAAAQSYVKARLAETHGKRAKRPILAYTAHKELKSFRHAWTWCHRMKMVPVRPEWELAELRIPKDREPEPFRTLAEIKAILDRGGVSPAEEKRYWAGLFLTREELRRLLEHIGGLKLEGFVLPMFAFAIYTGARRSEMMRSRVDDFDFRVGRVRLRELKRKKGAESTRSVDLHPTLAAIMRDWFGRHPGGQFTLARDDGSPLDPDLMDRRFEMAVKGTEWAAMRGFHVLRHSFASALAAAGVDQRIIDAFMGHRTEEMARRYRHLRPDTLKDAILALGM